jgi:hypothetical protein
MKSYLIMATVIACAGLMFWSATAYATCVTTDYVDIGKPASEAGHNLVSWGPIEPANSGGNYGGIDDCRAIYTPSDNSVWASIDLDFGSDPVACKLLTLNHLDGMTKDAFEVYINGVLVYYYPGDDLTTELWLTTTIPVCAYGVQTVKFVSTEPQWDLWATYGQMCFDVIEVQQCPTDCTMLDMVDIGDPTSETGHNLTAWGPIEPATSGGNYGGIDNCRPVWAPEDGDDWATVDMDFGDNPLAAKCLTMHHLDGIAADSFDLYVYPQGEAGLAQLVYSYTGNALSEEIWIETSVLVAGTGMMTLKFVSTQAQWGSWHIYGQMCFDILRVDECSPIKDTVDIGKPASETGHNLVGWGPIEPANSGGNYGGIDDCRAVYSPVDNDDWATVDLDFGCCIGLKCLIMEHLDGITKDAFEVYIYPVGEPDEAQLIFTYPGDDSTAEIWMTSSVLVDVTGKQTVKFVSTEPTWAQWGTYGQMCFNVITVKDFVPVSDYVDIGDPTSEAGHPMAGWGPIEPATSGGNYGGIDNCRPIYAPEDNNDWATIELDFGDCTEDTKCLIMYHLDGLARDAFEVYIYPPGGTRPATPDYVYPGDGVSVEVWYCTSFAVTATGKQIVEFVSTEDPWYGWATYGQMCFDRLVVGECDPGSTPLIDLTGAPDSATMAELTAGRITSVSPNPFNPMTEISFLLNRNGHAQLAVYDLRGRLVKVLVDEPLLAQEHAYAWDGTNAAGKRAASGIYFVQLRVDSATMEVRKVSLIK